MKKYLLSIFLIPVFVSAQNKYKAFIHNSKNEPLVATSVSIHKLAITILSDSSGLIVIQNIPNGKFELSFSYVGYTKKNIEISFPLKDTTAADIVLENEHAELQGVTVVSSTRSNRNIEIIPTRIEAITHEELDEKSSMKPGDIRMLLNESTGITTQQTSAVSGTANLRIQGLDGTYTQLLKDGMPLYNGFSGGLSIMQIPPLDLKQVEFIKGSASTLYGGGAIAGLVNLISKTPTPQKELSFLLNGNSAKGFDASGFYAQKFAKFGTTIFGAYNYNNAYDPANIGLSAIPKIDRFTLNPKLFFYPNSKTNGFVGVNMSFENRYGGDMKVLNGNADSVHQYFEKNISKRISTQFSIDHKLSSTDRIQFKNSIGFFNRNITQTTSAFFAQEILSFTEFNYVHQSKKSEWIAGLNMWTDNLTPRDTSTLTYQLNTIGAFVQNTYKPCRWLFIESGLRVDKNNPATIDKLKGIFFLPRMNLLFNINNNWKSRLGFGLGYKMPSPFNEDAEEKGYQNIAPINISNLKAEQSYGLHADVTYKKKVDEFFVSINQLVFYTQINNPLILSGNNFVNANGYINSTGAETNIRLSIDELNFYIGYTYADVKQHFNNTVTQQTLSPKNRVNFDVTYEIENKFRIGFEAFYTDKQLLSDGKTGKDYLIIGFLIQKMWKKMSVFINVENLTDQRQTKWDSIFTGSITHPKFRDIYAPLDGIVINSGIKINF
ncbi:MAG: TonB-dependent receptor plug domain-containing protein [Sphingobacteriia bacterium]|nr:TonB-dependent receptor plug domain-containing protein [Sphingobacteriia bacterium]